MSMKPHRKNTRYSPEVALRLCRRLAQGESLHAICNSSDMPSRDTVYKSWLKKYPDFACQFAIVRALHDDAARCMPPSHPLSALRQVQEESSQQNNQNENYANTENTEKPTNQTTINLETLDIAQLAREVISLADQADPNDPLAIKKAKLQIDARRWYVNWAMLNHWRNQHAAHLPTAAQTLLADDMQNNSDVYASILEQQIQNIDAEKQTEQPEQKSEPEAEQITEQTPQQTTPQETSHQSSPIPIDTTDAPYLYQEINDTQTSRSPFT